MSDRFESDEFEFPRPVLNGGSAFIQGQGLRDFVKRLWTHNPFYLISVALVLHSARLWHHDSVEAFNPWPLMSIIGGYLLLVAVTGFLLIKLGRVWDDARSIFLVILLLFVELSLTFDSIVIRDPRRGAMLLISGWSAAVVISEALLRGLRIRLPWTYRGPYHLLLALMFLYPLAIVSGYGSGESVVWRIFWFSPCVAVVLIMLLPAIHRGQADVARNGTPWQWPWYPWTLFGFLTVCLGLRAWALTLSFDPVIGQGLDEAMRLQGAFGGYFLVPIVLALGVLLLEAGIVERRMKLQLAGLAAPLLGVLLALPMLGGSAHYEEFRSQFVGRFGSPVWLTLNGCWLFYCYALVRGVKPAVLGILGSAAGILLFVRLSPATTYPIGHPALPLLLTSAFGLLWSVRRQDSRVFVAGLIGVCLAVRDMTFAAGSPLLREAITENIACLGILASGFLFRDYAAQFWRRLGVVLLAANCGAAAVLPTFVDPGLPEGLLLAYCWLLTALLATCAWSTGWVECRSAAAGCLAISISRLLLDLADMMKKTFHWDGALYFVGGLGVFVIAVMISLWKSTNSPLSQAPAQIGDLAEPTA